MGIIKSVVRFAFYPIARPAEQAKESYGKIKGDIDALRLARAKRAIEHEEELINHIALTENENWEGYKPTEEELRNPLKIKDAYMRFEVLYELNNWNEEELKTQLKAVLLTKRASAYSSAILLLAGLVSLYFMAAWMILIFGPILITGSAVGFASAVKHSIYEIQIENRKLITYKELMSRHDFFKFLFV